MTAPARHGRPRLAVIAGGGLAVVAAITAIWLAWPASPGTPGAGRVRHYLTFSACLLTDSRGLAGSDAAAAWSGMQQASLATRAMVSYLPVAGPPTRAAALPYLASLVQRHCRVIVAVGPAQASAVAESSARFSDIRFLVVAGRTSGRTPTANVVPISAGPAAGVRAAIEAAVSQAVSQDGVPS